MSIQKYQTKNGNRYRVNKMINGKRFSRSFKNQKDAQDWLSIINHSGEDSTLGKVAHVELHQLETSQTKIKTPDYSSVVKAYQSTNLGLKCDHALKQLNYFFPFWEKLPINSITRIMVENALDDLALERNLSGPTINRYQAAISSLFKWAAQQRKYRSLQLVNPTIGIVRRKESKGREVFLSKDQQHDLLNSCKNSKWKGLYPLITLLLATGARRNEIASLKWSNVNFSTAEIVFINTKNGEDHRIKINTSILNLLKGHKLAMPLSVWVFPHVNDPKKPMINFDHYWKAAKEESFMPEDLRIHDLRHTTASTMLADGFSLEEIKQTLNHKSVLMTNRYAHHAKLVDTVAKRNVDYLVR